MFERKQYPKGPKIQKVNLAYIFQSRLKKANQSLGFFNPDLQNSPPPPYKIGVWWMARLKIAISLEIFNARGRS